MGLVSSNSSLFSLYQVASESEFRLPLMGLHRHHELGRDHEIQGHHPELEGTDPYSIDGDMWRLQCRPGDNEGCGSNPCTPITHHGTWD